MTRLIFVIVCLILSADEAVGQESAGSGWWTPTSGVPVEGSALVALRDGRVLAIGGLGARRKPISTVRIWDPHGNKWQEVAALPQALSRVSATVLA